MIQGKCTATKKNGQACSGRPILESDHCVAHHPEASTWRAQGGRAKSNIERAHARFPEGLKPIVGGLIEAFEQTHTGALEPRAAQAMASVASSLIRVAEFALLSERLENIETELRNRGAIE